MAIRKPFSLFLCTLYLWLLSHDTIGIWLLQHLPQHRVKRGKGPCLFHWHSIDWNFFTQRRLGYFPIGSVVKNPPVVQETQEMRVQSLGWGDPLEEEIATRSSIFAGNIPWTEGPGGLQSMGLQRVGHDWSSWARVLNSHKIHHETSHKGHFHTFPKIHMQMFCWKFSCDKRTQTCTCKHTYYMYIYVHYMWYI